MLEALYNQAQTRQFFSERKWARTPVGADYRNAGRARAKEGAGSKRTRP